MRSKSVYDEAGHLLGEYSSTGALIQETIWLGDLPVATLRPSGSTVAIYYVHTDHLGSVRKVGVASFSVPKVTVGNADNYRTRSL